MFSCAEYIYYIIINCVSKLVKLINSLIKSRIYHLIHISFRVLKINQPALPVSRPLSYAAETANGPNVYEICTRICVRERIFADNRGMLRRAAMRDK